MKNNKNVVTRIITPNSVFFEEHTNFVNVETSNGYATFLPDHSPLVSSIKPSTLIMEVSHKKHIAVILDGVISVTPSHIQIICNEIFWQKDINIEKEKKIFDDLEQKISKIKDRSSFEYKNLKLNMKKTEAKIIAKDVK